MGCYGGQEETNIKMKDNEVNEPHNSYPSMHSFER